MCDSVENKFVNSVNFNFAIRLVLGHTVLLHLPSFHHSKFENTKAFQVIKKFHFIQYTQLF